MMMLILLVGLVSLGSAHVAVDSAPPTVPIISDEASLDLLLEEHMPRTASCPQYCNCSFSVTGKLEEAVCYEEDPYLVLSTSQRINKLSLINCLESSEMLNISSSSVQAITSLRLENCRLDPASIQRFNVFKSLRHLEVVYHRDSIFEISCESMEKMEYFKLHNSDILSNPVKGCPSSQLQHLNLSHNSILEFNMADLQGISHLHLLDLSGNQLQRLEPSPTALPLRTLILKENTQLDSLCSQTFHSLKQLETLDISNTGVTSLSLGLLQLEHLAYLRHEDVLLTCDCKTTLRLQNVEREWLSDDLKCIIPESNERFNVTDTDQLERLNCGELEILDMTESAEILVGSEVRLDCPVSGEPNYETLWLSPRMELLRLFVGPGSCPAFQDHIDLAPTTSDYSDWDNHYRILDNGSLLIDAYGWRDRGEFICYVDNGVSNASASVHLSLNYHYRNRVYYLSLAFGFGGAACFLGLTLLGKLLHYLLWNYGCCLCCSCCKDQQPPKIKKLTKVVDSIETYRIQQLEKLRENYNLQSQRIRDNYTLQMEKVRDNYNYQIRSLKEMKNQGSAQCAGVKDQYFDQISKIREYSSSQLDRCHENYIFQRQRLRKFSAQNYLKIRETKKYTQKTLNRVLDNMPALYLDLSSCKQGLGDQDLREWQAEMDQREAEMKDILNIDKQMNFDEIGLGDSQSLYFTPSGTPMRDISLKGTPVREDGLPNGGIHGVSRSPDKCKRGHRRMVSNLSNFLPFWWGMNQQSTNHDTVETVAIVESNHSRDEDESDVLLPHVAADGRQESPVRENVVAAASAQAEPSPVLLERADPPSSSGDVNDQNPLASHLVNPPNFEELNSQKSEEINPPISREENSQTSVVVNPLSSEEDNPEKSGAENPTPSGDENPHKFGMVNPLSSDEVNPKNFEEVTAPSCGEARPPISNGGNIIDSDSCRIDVV